MESQNTEPPPGVIPEQPSMVPLQDYSVWGPYYPVQGAQQVQEYSQQANNQPQAFLAAGHAGTNQNTLYAIDQAQQLAQNAGMYYQYEGSATASHPHVYQQQALQPYSYMQQGYQYPAYGMNQAYSVTDTYQQHHFPLAYPTSSSLQNFTQTYAAQPPPEPSEPHDEEPPGLAEVNPPLPEDKPSIPGVDAPLPSVPDHGATQASEQQVYQMPVQVQQQQAYNPHAAYYTYGYQQPGWGHYQTNFAPAVSSQTTSVSQAAVPMGPVPSAQALSTGHNSLSHQDNQIYPVASSMDWYSSTPSLNCAGHPSQLAQTTANPKFEAAKNVPSHQGSSVSDLQSAHGLVPNTSSSIAKNTSGGRVAFVIKKQMGKGTAKSAAARFGQEREVAYLKVGQSSQGQMKFKKAKQDDQIVTPPAFTAYKDRVLAAYTSKMGKEKAEAMVQVVLAKAQATGQVWSTDWSKLPAPSEDVLVDRAQSFLLKQTKPVESRWLERAQEVANRFEAQQAALRSAAAAAAASKTVMDTSSEKEKGVLKGQAPKTKKGGKEQDQSNPWWLGRKGEAVEQADNESETRIKSKTGKKKKRAAAKASPILPGENNLDPTEKLKRQKRAARFGNGQASGVGPGRGLESFSWEEENDAVQGTCQDLEKSYIRLSDVPDASAVRPEPVLRKALDRLVGLIRNPGVKYFYSSDQFKGMRQDCFVQRLNNTLAVEIYEAHGRAALQYGDLWEYNQCQALLIDLYDTGLRGCQSEFLAYRMLYQGFHTKKGEGFSLRKTFWKTEKLEKEGFDLPEVAHAREVLSATFSLDSWRFFELYVAAPKLSRALMDEAVESVRFQSVRQFASSYRHGSIPLSFMVQLLGFLCPDGHNWNSNSTKYLPGCSEDDYHGKAEMKTSEEDAIDACKIWLEAHGAVIKGDLASGFSFLPQESKSKLFVPKEENAVAHGDANLTLGNFLTRRIV